MYDVARLAGVSTATVSRVMRGSDLVRPDTRERVLAVIDEVGFVPDASAQGLSRRRKEIIGLVALERAVDETDIERDGLLFVDQLVHAVEAVLRGTECSLLLSFGPSGEHFQQRIRALSGKVDGLLVVEDVTPAAQLRTLARRLPVVAIAASPGEAGLDAVRVDNSGGMRALAEHLLTGHGYRRLGFAAGPPDAPDAVERLTAFSSPALTTVSQPFRELGARAAARLIQRIEGSEAAPRADVLPTGLVIRRSCGCPVAIPGLSSGSGRRNPRSTISSGTRAGTHRSVGVSTRGGVCRSLGALRCIRPSGQSSVWVGGLGAREPLLSLPWQKGWVHTQTKVPYPLL